jgi:steroid delta-isomerase-like uncharacterized protein
MNPKELALKWFDEVWNKKKPATIAEMMDVASVGLSEGGEIKGPDEFRTAVYEPMVRAFPDVNVKVDSIISEGDEVALRWTVTASHFGPMMDLAASGKRVKFSGMTWLKFANGKIVGGSDSYNLHGLVSFLSGGPESASVRGA